MRVFEKGLWQRGLLSASRLPHMDMPRLADLRPFHVADPLDEKMLSGEHQIYSLTSEGREIGWSIHDFDARLEAGGDS